jgi:GNAT superfamily N-acetyltransferase
MPVSLSDLEIVFFDPKEHDVSTFDCGDEDLNDFLKNDAVKFQTEHLSHTRLVYLEGVLVGYVTLLADCIILKTDEKKKTLHQARSQHQTIYTFPAIKIGRIGIQKEHQKAGIGTQLLNYTIALVYRLNKELNVGCRFITLDAYPQSVSWYEKKKFVFNKHYNRTPSRTAGIIAFCRAFIGKEKKIHPSMRYDILKSPEIH